MSFHTLILQNPAPRAYKNNPRPPPDLALNTLELFAEDVCNVSIDSIPEVGTEYKDYTVTEEHRAAMICSLLEQPVEIEWLGGPQETQMNIPDDASLTTQVAMVKTCWNATCKVAPTEITGSNDLLVAAVKSEYKLS